MAQKTKAQDAIVEVPTIPTVLTVTAALRLPGQTPSGISKGHYRIQSRGRLRHWAPLPGPPFLIPD
jgi:hypothetical protein